MKHNELLKYVNDYVTLVELNDMPATAKVIKSLRAVVELHRPEEIRLLSGDIADTYCYECEGFSDWPCPTIQVIEKELYDTTHLVEPKPFILDTTGTEVLE